MNIDIKKIDAKLRRYVGSTFYCKTVRFEGYDVGQIWEKFPAGDRKVIDILDPWGYPCNFNDEHLKQVIEHREKLRRSKIGKKFDAGDDYATHEKWIKDIKSRKATSADD